MKPYSIYTIDFFIRGTYVIISFLSCWVIFLSKVDTLFLFEVYPLLSNLSSKRLILTQLTELINTIWFLCTFFSSIFILPLVFCYTRSFFGLSWYIYQLKFYESIFFSSIFIFLPLYFLLHFFVVSNLITFLLYWEVLNEYSLLRIEAEISLFFYVDLIVKFKFTLSFFLTLIFLTFLKLLYFLNSKILYSFTLLYKKIILFTIICFLFLCIPPDIIIQLYLILIIYFLIEILIFFICIKLYKTTT